LGLVRLVVGETIDCLNYC